MKSLIRETFSERQIASTHIKRVIFSSDIKRTVHIRKVLFLALVSICFISSFSSCNILPRGVSLYALSSYGGAPIGEVSVTVTGSSAKSDTDDVSVEGITGVNGLLLLDLDPGLYTITLSKSGYAESVLQDYYLTENREMIELILPPLGIESAIVKAPLFDSIQFENAAGVMEPIVSGYTLLNTGSIVAGVLGSLPVVPTLDAGNGVGLLFDATPGGFGSFLPNGTPYLGEPEGDLYLTQAVFEMSNKIGVAGDHVLCLTAYDIANNRCEMRIPVKTVVLTTDDSTLDSDYPIIAEYEMKTFGVDRLILGDDPVYRSGTGYMVISIEGTNASGAYKEYSGFEIYRTEKGKLPYQKVKTVHLSARSDPYELVEGSIDLQPGKVFEYKVRAFNATGFSKFSRIGGAKMLPEHTIGYLQPTALEVVNPETASIQFEITNYSALKSAGAEQYHFYFNLNSSDGLTTLKSTSGYIPFFTINLKTNEILLANSTTEIVTASYISFADGLFSIDMSDLDDYYSNFSFQDGTTWEWYLDYGLHGPEAYILNTSGEDPFVESSSIASSNEYAGAVQGSSMIFSIDRSVQ